MEYVIRDMDKLEYRLLEKFLYEAIFVPKKLYPHQKI